MSKFFNILLAEDDGADFEFFSEAFKKISPDYKITRAKTGLECMRMLKNPIKPDLIFLDLKMPGYTGIDCLKFIKDNENLADIPVIIYSESHYLKDIHICFKKGAHFYIVKPALGDLLVNLLKHVIDNLQESLKQPNKENFVVRVGVTIEE